MFTLGLLFKVATAAVATYAGFRLLGAAGDDTPDGDGAAPGEREAEGDGSGPEPEGDTGDEITRLRIMRELDSIRYSNRSLKRLAFGLGANVAAVVTASTALALVSYMVLGVVVFSDLLRRAYVKLVYQKKLGFEVPSALIIVLLGLSAQILAFYIVLFVFQLASRARIRMLSYAHESIQGLIDAQVDVAWLVTSDGEVEVPASTLRPGDLVVVYTGAVVPCDGVVRHGFGTVDQQVLTGESRPAEKAPGDEVCASTLVMGGKLVVEVQKAGDETFVFKMAQLLDNTMNYAMQHSEVRVHDLADRQTAPVLGLIFGFFYFGGVPMAATAAMGWGSARMRVVASIGMLNQVRLASSKGILIKDIRAAEMFYDADVVLFDKTGTLTKEVPELRRILSFHPDYSEHAILRIAAIAEVRWTHPIARAIVAGAEERGIELPEWNDGEYEVGYGIRVELEGRRYAVGSLRFMALEGAIASPAVEVACEAIEANGGTLVYVAADGVVVGALQLMNTLRPGAADVIRELKARGIKSIGIVSGDSEAETARVAESLGVDSHHAEMLPNDKVRIIEELQRQGQVVCFVGDGINDALALKKAQVSISMSGASLAATESASITLMRPDLSLLVTLYEISEGLYDNVRSSLAVNSLAPGVFAAGAALARLSVYPAVVFNIATWWLGLYLRVRQARALPDEQQWTVEAILEQLYLTPETWNGDNRLVTSTEKTESSERPSYAQRMNDVVRLTEEEVVALRRAATPVEVGGQ